MMSAMHTTTSPTTFIERTGSLTLTSPRPRQPSLTIPIPDPPPTTSRRAGLKSILTPKKRRQSQPALTHITDDINRIPQDQSSSLFLSKLPYEVRELVYLHLLQDNQPSFPASDGVLISMPDKTSSRWRNVLSLDAAMPGVNASSSRKPRASPSPGRTAFTRLLRTCLLLYSEAQPLLYARTKITIPSLPIFLNFSSRIPMTSVMSIRNLQLRVSFPWLLFPQADAMRTKVAEQIQHFNENEWSSTWQTIAQMSGDGGHLKHLNLSIKARTWSAHPHWPTEPIPDVREKLFAPLQAITTLEKKDFLVEVSWALDYGDLPLPPEVNQATGEITELVRGEIAWWRGGDIPFTLREMRRPTSLGPDILSTIPPTHQAGPAILATGHLPDFRTLDAAQLMPTPADDFVFDVASSKVNVARALYPYLPDPLGEDTEIAFAKNELLTVRNKEGRKQWWPARNEKGEVGVVPSNYLKVLEESEVAELRRMGVLGAGVGGNGGGDGGGDGGGGGGANAGHGGVVFGGHLQRNRGRGVLDSINRTGERTGWGWA